MSRNSPEPGIEHLPSAAGGLSRDSILELLFPGDLRDFPGRHWILNILRASHIAFLCPLVGGIFFGHDVSTLTPWWIGTLLSGLGIFLIDLYGSCIALFEVRGLSVLIKLGLLGLMPFLATDQQLLMLVFLIIGSSLLSHGRRSLRHKSFMPGRFRRRYGFREAKPGLVAQAD